METNEKQFDAVKMMREIRDNLSHEFEHMNFEEEKVFIKKHLNTPDPRKLKEGNKAPNKALNPIRNSTSKAPLSSRGQP